MEIPCYFFLGKGFKISRIFRVGLPTRGTEAVLVGTDSMPTKTAYLIAAGAGEEIQIVHLQRFHTQRALHRVLTALIQY